MTKEILWKVPTSLWIFDYPFFYYYKLFIQNGSYGIFNLNQTLHSLKGNKYLKKLKEILFRCHNYINFI